MHQKSGLFSCLSIKSTWNEFRGEQLPASIKKGGMSYEDQLVSLNLLPLVYDREIKDLTYFYKLLHGFYNLNVLDFVSFVNHTRTSHCKNPSLVLKVLRCKTITFQSSFFNRIVPLWNCICTL